MLSKTALRRAGPAAARQPLAAALTPSPSPSRAASFSSASVSTLRSSIPSSACSPSSTQYLASRSSRALLASSASSASMPLRAKIRVPRPMARSLSTTTSTSRALWRELPEDESEDVLFTSTFGTRTIELNRPAKYNSLNASMIRKIAPRLLEWEKSDMANIIIVKGAGEKAFCAGGDVTALAESNQKGAAGQQWSSDYFALEYKLDHLIATYSKPYVAFMDGFTMGGGVGLSVHAPFRIATERTVFAMPETNIGFFPDVGASFFLPRLPGAVGTYLALTSERLVGPNVFYAGLASHYLHSSSLPALEARLAELQFMDYDSYDKRVDMINNTIEEFCTGLPHDQPILIGGNLRRAIDRCFGHNSVAAIVAALTAEAEAVTSPETPYTDDQTRAWAAKTLKTLEHRSPTSVHVALRQMRIGGRWPIGQAFRREHLIASRFMKHPDFTEGVSSLLIRKDKGRPNWTPSTLAEIGDSAEASQAITDPFFAERDETNDPEMLALLNNRTYSEYPYVSGEGSNIRVGLPTEQDVFEVVNEGGKTPREVVNQLIGRYRGKQGVKEVVAEIVERKTTVTSRGNVEWAV